MSFDDSLGKKLEARTAKAYVSLEASTRQKGITLYETDLRMLPTMPLSFMSDIGALVSGDISRGDAVALIASCFEEDDRVKFHDIVRKKHVDVSFVNDFIEFVNEYYSDDEHPTVEPSGSSNTGALTAVESQPATSRTISVDAIPVTPSA